MLTGLELKLSYRSNSDNLIEDFYTPCLTECDNYKRCAGYFTSSGLALAARGVASLAARGGVMQLVVSPHLEADDIDALQRAIDDPEEVLKAITNESFPELVSRIEKDSLNALAWLAASKRLEIRIALRVDSKKRIKRGLYHEKVGIFTDSDGFSVAFSGSSNETAGGLIENFESIEVFCSWKNDKERISKKIKDFDNLWNNQTEGLHVLEFSKAAAEILERYRDPNNPPLGVTVDTNLPHNSGGKFKPPTSLKLRDYQEEAIKSWAKNKGRGILSMATGSGKTITALTLASRVAEKNPSLVVIIICPFLNLCNQWMDEVAMFNHKAIRCYEGLRRWEDQLNDGYQSISTGLDKVMVIVTTNKTYQSEVFQSKIKTRIKKIRHLLIADEAHNLGAKKINEVLHDDIKLRLGLSATPERHNDEEGTDSLVNYFGGITYEYSLQQAIKDKRLCNYMYYPHLVELTDEETIEYQSITEQLGRALNYSRSGDLSDNATYLLIKRARLMAGAENKITKLDEVISNLSEIPQKALFYCGDGRTSDPISNNESRQIEAISKLLGEKHELRIRNFTFKEKAKERERILSDLGKGLLDGVVAIRCLDEGIDLPDLRMGFILASSTNPRQFIQRRGRLLRKAKGKDLAIIHDFIITPPDFGGDVSDSAYNLERKFFRRELSRIQDFCETAENGQTALGSLQALRIKYNLIST
ncbi:MAG: DEAD/DEAH box helicase family protein [Saprospiraceae bacterium]|nr:DEAD/DEAH box helicase family protein [Saprospiraceae bacterium]